MTVGETLAQARSAAGLSVDEVSGRTGIRETVIRDVESDDFGALGGDLYVRGYLRAIAAAIGLDPQPLIREFDAAPALSVARVSEPAVSEPAVSEPVTVGLARILPDSSPEPGTDVVAEPAVDAPAGEDYTSPWWADDAVSDADPLPAPQTVPDVIPFRESAPLGSSVDGLPVDGAAPWSSAPQPARPGHTARPGRTARPVRRPAPGTARRSRVRGWRWATAISVFAVVILAVVGIATAQIVAKVHSPGHASAAATPTVRLGVADESPVPSSSASPATAVVAPAVTKSAVARPKATPKPKPKPKPKAKPKPQPAVQLAVQEASAFGPDGVADGDNPQGARNVITPGAGLPWQTDWYTTATFGMLKDGTGLLLDLGQTATVTSVQIRLGGIAGVGLQVRAGDAASLGTSPVLASAQDAGGAFTLRFKAPVRARYVIIWFTELPPSGDGQYQAAVYSVAVTGHP